MLPFYVAPGEPRHARRRMLLISYHFPPGNQVGALRWRMMVRHAESLGWATDVITVGPGTVGQADTTSLELLPSGTHVYGVAPSEHWTRHLIAAAVRARRRLHRKETGPSASQGAVASADIGRPTSRSRALVRTFFAWQYHAEYGHWASRVAACGVQRCSEVHYDAVVSSGPPHLAHEAARKVARRMNLALVVDFRDPWSLVERVPEWVASTLWFALSRRYERRVVAAADVVALNTERSRRALADLYPQHQGRMITVMNGTDDIPMPESNHNSRFVIAFAGSIYLDRDPRVLFRAAANVVYELGLTPDEFGLEFIGNVEAYGGVPISQIASEEGVAAFVRTGPPRARSEALEFLAGAAMLVSLPQDSEMAVPAKLFEYVQFDAWLLVFAARESATELLLRGTGADVIAPTDVRGTQEAIRAKFTAFRAGERPRAIGADGRFSRRRQAEVLFDAMDRAVEAR